MKITRLALIASLLAAMALPGIAQMSTMDQDQQAFMATVQQGPRVRAGLPMSADVFVNGVFALRVPASAGGLTPMQRAEVIANRMNQAFAAGSSWQDTQVLRRDGLWTVNVGNTLIATADINSARAYGIQTGQLASRWARQSVVAMGGQPQMIAQQLQPIATAVAGAQEELGAAWAISPVRSVPAIDVSTGQTIGNITVAGPQNSLSRVNSTAVFAYDTDSANAYVFVPTTNTSITGVNAPRVMGVGVVRIPAGMIDMTGIRTGSDALQAINVMTPAEWNADINNQAAAWQVRLNASTKVVPLYSLDGNQIIGAAQIVGSAANVARAQAVAASSMNGSMAFSATATAPTAISGQPSALNDVLVSAIIVFPSDMAPDESEMTPDDTTPTP